MKNINKFLLVITIISCLCTSILAVGSLEEIKAYLNYGIGIEFNGVEQTMHDANGNRVYPISYNGTTYVPVRAVSNILGVPVEWDGTNNKVLLGTNNEKDFIETLEPIGGEKPNHYSKKDGSSITIGEKTYNNHMFIGYDYSLIYNLNKKYSKLTIDVHSRSVSKDTKLEVIGDNEKVLATINVEPNELPKTFTVDVSNVEKLTFKGTNGIYYIVNAKIK